MDLVVNYIKTEMCLILSYTELPETGNDLPPFILYLVVVDANGKTVCIYLPTRAQKLD
jgi:hypothetical protein